MKTEAIVLSKLKYFDNSLIVCFYSLEYGLFSSIIHLSKTKSGTLKQNLFFPLNILETEVNFKNTRNIQNIKYCNRQVVLTEICCNVYKTCIAQFIAEIIYKSIKEEESNPELYNFIKNTIILLENSKNFSNIHLIFIKEFAKLLGFGITNNFCNETPYFSFKDGIFLPVFTTNEMSLEESESKNFSQILELNFNNFTLFSINNKLKQYFLITMIKYYKIHFNGNFSIKSLEITTQIFHQ